MQHHPGSVNNEPEMLYSEKQCVSHKMVLRFVVLGTKKLFSENSHFMEYFGMENVIKMG